MKTTKDHLKEIYFLDDYKNFADKIKPQLWESYWKSHKTKNIKNYNSTIYFNEQGYLVGRINEKGQLTEGILFIHFTNEFTIVLVAEKETYIKDGIVNLSTENDIIFLDGIMNIEIMY